MFCTLKKFLDLGKFLPICKVKYMAKTDRKWHFHNSAYFFWRVYFEYKLRRLCQIHGRESEVQLVILHFEEPDEHVEFRPLRIYFHHFFRYFFFYLKIYNWTLRIKTPSVSCFGAHNFPWSGSMNFRLTIPPNILVVQVLKTTFRLRARTQKFYFNCCPWILGNM